MNQPGFRKTGRGIGLWCLGLLLSGCLPLGFGPKDRTPQPAVPDGIRDRAGYPEYVQVVGMDYFPADFSAFTTNERSRRGTASSGASNQPSLDQVPLQELVDELHHRLSVQDLSGRSNAGILANLKTIERKLEQIEGQLARNRFGAASLPSSSVTPVPLYDDPVPAVPAAPGSEAVSTDVQWLFRKDPGYTVQLVSMHRHASVVRFLEDHHLSGKDTRIFLWVNEDGVDWHFGLFGRFDSDRLARQAVHEHLNGLAGQARVRRLDDIRQMVCRSRGHLEPPSPELESACAGRPGSA